MLDVSNRVKRALFDKGWTQKKLCGEIEVTETGFKRMAENHTWKLDTIEKIAEALGIPIVYFFEKEEKSNTDLTKPKVSDSYLEEHIVKLERSFTILSEQFNSQILIKDQQIAGLQRTVDALVGKSEDATGNPLSFEEFKFEVMYDHYRRMVSDIPFFSSVPSFQLAAQP